MYQSTQLVLGLFALPALLSSLCSANSLYSCADVECPLREGSTGPGCHIANQTLVTVGVSSFSVSIPGQDELPLAWTVGMNHYDHINESDSAARYIERVYYLGTPPSVNFTADDLGYAGCAFYLTNPENKNLFYDNGYHDPGALANTSVSYCQAHLAADGTDDNPCIPALTAELSALAGAHAAGSPESRTCPQIASALQSALPPSCAGLGSARVHGVALTGAAAAAPLSASENATSNCYPTLPKSNVVTRQFAYNISSSLYANDTGPDAGGETPILSMFWSTGGGRNASIVKPAIRLTCLRPIDMTTAARESAKKSAAASMHGGLSLLRVAVSASAATLFVSWLM